MRCAITWPQAGYTTLRGFGGCNDLIFSGHAAFWVMAPLALQTYYARHRCAARVGRLNAALAVGLGWAGRRGGTGSGDSHLLVPAVLCHAP